MNIKMNLINIVVGFFLLYFPVQLHASSDWYSPGIGFDGVKVRVIQTSYYDKNNKKDHLYGLHFKINDGWTVYGEDSVGIGIAPSFNISKSSSNVNNYSFYWPEARKVETVIGEDIYRYEVYKNEVVIPFELYGDLQDGSEVELHLTYGACNEICIPVNNKISFKVTKAINEESFNKISGFVRGFDFKISTVSEDNAVKDSGGDYFSMNSFVYFLLLAFLGGLILNIMPCVLPVLSIKLISILKNRKYNANIIKFSFASTIIGILFSFLFLAIIAALIAISGEVFNWGIQFQSPIFLTTLIMIFTLYVANILGYFNFAASYQFSNFLNKKINNNDAKKRLFLSNFFSGILAVLLATPCSAPFLGAAITFSVIQPPIYSFAIFLMMGIGFAFPYIILIIKPDAIRMLPRSGNWMVTFKNILAVFVIITALWLCYVLAKNSSLEVGYAVTIMSILLVLSFRISYKLPRTICVLTLVLSIFTTPFSGLGNGTELKSDKKTISSSQWQHFERYEIAKHVAEGKVVVVDVTADWCITCKFNQFRVLRSEDVKKILDSEDVIAMRADITRPNKSVMEFINSYSRYAIPFNIVFGPNAKEGILLGELLSKDEFIATIKKASK